MAAASSLKSIITYWPLVMLLVGGAAAVGEARYRLGRLEGDVTAKSQRHELRSQRTNEEIRRMNEELRIGLGKVQLSQARICAKLDVRCD
jgi:hypothetical protein